MEELHKSITTTSYTRDRIKRAHRKQALKRVEPLMRVIVLVSFFVVTMVLLAKATHYNERMNEINTTSCAINGMMSDCTTPLKTTPENALNQVIGMKGGDK